MKTNYYKIISAIILCSVYSSSNAQFSMSGEIRPRTEYRHGFASLAASDQDFAFFIDQRTRLNLDYKALTYNFKISLQDIRTWGSQSQLNTVDGLTSIHEAWGEVLMGKKFEFKFGRQEIIYDDHRIFGSVDWTQQARSHDAGIIKYVDSTFTAHLGFAYNQNKPQTNTTYYSVTGNYKSLLYLWAHKDFSNNFGVSVLALNNGLETALTDTSGALIGKVENYSQTYGTMIVFKKSKISVDGTFYYQMGWAGTWVDTKINAYLIGLSVSNKINEQLSATLGFEMQSGQSETDTSATYKKTNHAFTPFYGTNHKFNGHMDYFYVGNHIGSVGLRDIFLKVNYKTDKYDFGIDAHSFAAAANVLDDVNFKNNGTYMAMSSGLGIEIDTYFGFNLAKSVAFKAGYSHMLGTESLVALKGGDTDATSNWGWAMIIIKPTFFTSK